MVVFFRRNFILLTLCIFASAGLSVRLRAAVPGKLPAMSYLDNRVIRVGVDLRMGGAITWLSKSGSKINLINNYHHNYGRSLQMSDYSGPVPYIPPGKTIAPAWRSLGWNPVQAGDAFHHASRVLFCKNNDARSLVVRCIPMQWPLDNVPSRCTFETRLTLDGPTVRVSNVMTVFRKDHTQYPAMRQEMPALYTSSHFYRLFTYNGDRPFTGAPTVLIDPASRIAKALSGFPGGVPIPVLWFSHPLMTENWAALVDKSGFGLGIWEPGSYRFAGGFFGRPDKGGPDSYASGYASPRQTEIIDHNIRFAYRYVLIVGTVKTIRQYVYAHAHPVRSPVWRFKRSRRHWSYINARDTGWPIKGRLNISLAQGNPEMIGPVAFWRASQNPVLYIDAKFTKAHGRGGVFWRGIHAPGFSAGNSLTFPIRGDGRYHLYAIRLAASKTYRGAMIQLRVDPVLDWHGRAGAWCAVRSIGFTAPQK